MRSYGPFVILSVFGLVATHAQTPPKLALQSIVSGLSLPVFVTAPAGETNRLFVVEQHAGRIRVLHLATRTVAPDPFLTVNGVTTGNEQGLLGLAFHPSYASNGFIYVNYTTAGGGAAGHSEITRFQAQGDPRTATTADPASKTVLLTYNQPESNHNAGWLGFGLDGYLYISTGDGGGGNDQHGAIGNGQNRNVLLGKILRIDVDHGSPYSIPDTNPFRDMASGKPEIWAFGLRNPWRCSIDRLTGDLWIGDVGQNTREEVDVIPAGVGGLNFGWRPREGSVQNPAYPSELPVTPSAAPVYDYGRNLGFTVIGGYRYRGGAIAGLHGTYLFADYGSGRFWSFEYNGTNQVNLQERTSELNPSPAKPVGQLSSFGEDATGELYLCDLAGGRIHKIVAAQSVSSIQLTNARLDGGSFSFEFQPVPGQAYVAESRESLSSGSWQALTNIPSIASPEPVTVRDALRGTRGFYRVRTD